MKLRFGIDAGATARIRAVLDAASEEPPIGRRLSYIYLDTPDGALAAHGAALRFRRSTAIGAPSPARPWRRQEIWSKTSKHAGKSFKKLAIPSLKKRLEATFSVRIIRWTWVLPDARGTVSLDDSEVATGPQCESFTEVRMVCGKKHAEVATQYAVELGAMHLSTARARERGLALLQASG